MGSDVRSLEFGRRGARVAVAEGTVEPRRTFPGTVGEVMATCFNPGIVATDLGRDTAIGTTGRSPLRRLMKSPDQGADTLVWLATTSTDRLRQGGYYSNRHLGIAHLQARSGRLARQLWDRSEQLVAKS